MDFISHGLIGTTVGLLQKDYSKKSVLKTTFFGVLPDLFQIPYYFALGHLKNRPFNWPQVSDWDGFRGTHPWLDALWDVPHSLLFAFVLVLPLIKFFKQSNFLFYAYLVHLLIDIPTHTGEWGVRFLWPLNLKLSGLTDAWAWDYDFLVISWATLFILNVAIYKFGNSKKT